MDAYWHLAAVFSALMAALVTLMIFIVRYAINKCTTDTTAALNRCAADTEKRCTELAVQVEKHQTVERQLLELKADLPISYVRKEDFIRHEVVINTKLDRIYTELTTKKGENQ